MPDGWNQDELSRREREIMAIVYRRGAATAADVLADLADPPAYSAVRTMLARLERKGHLRHREAGRRYVYEPTVSRPRAGRSAVRWLTETFFDRSPGKAAAAFLGDSGAELTDGELDELDRLLNGIRRRRTR